MSENGKTVFSCKKDYEGTVVIPEGVTRIWDDAFVGCTNLKEILVDENNLDYCSKDGVLYSKLMSILYVVPCCKDSIEIPEYVLVIKDHAFEGCSNLKSITIPDSVSVIGNHTFRDCTNLTSIKIPSSVTTVVRDTFSCCTSLKEILVDEKNPNYCSWDGALYAKDMKTLIAIPHGKDSIEIPDGVAEISDNAFEGCKSLTSIEIPGSVTTIGWSAFSGCSSLKSIEIPGSVTKIEGFTFYGCSSLTSIVIPDGVTEIGWSAFEGCTSLTSIEIPNSVTEIERSAFLGCSKLTSIKIPDGVTEIWWNTFEGCSSLKEILVDEKNPNYCSWDGALYAKDTKTLIAIPHGKDSIEIPDGVAEISDNAFEGCKNLTSIEIPSSVTKIGWVAFNGCTSLKSITIPEGVPVIWAGTFQGCTNLISITIPSSVATIQSWAFRRCTSLKEIHLKHKNPKNFAEAFKDIDPSNVTIYVPKGSVKAYRNSIHYKSFKTIIEEE